MVQNMEMRGGGWLRVQQDGPKIRLDAGRPPEKDGLYKVWLHGDRGGKFLLGTLVPEQEGLRLTRRVSLSELEHAGCWPQFWSECKLAFSFSNQGRHPQENWYCEQHPERMIQDITAKRGIHGPMLCRRRKDGFALAAPLRTNCPIPLEPLFCLAQVERWPTGPHMIWEFDEEGQPQIPDHKSAHDET